MKAWTCAAAIVSFAALLAVPRTATAQDELRIARVSRPVGADAQVLVSVPRALSGRTLAPNAFTVSIDGSPVTATATREVGRGFDVALVIETSTLAPEQQFVATKAAAVEFILQQPSDTRVALFASDPPGLALGLTADRAALVASIRGLARAPGDGLVSALALALVASATDTARPVTIIAVATAGDATVPATALRDERAAALRTGPNQLFAVGAVSESLAQLAADSGGFARNADVRQLVGAFDAVASDLAGRYRLTFPLPADATRLDVQVAAPEGTAAASVDLASASKSVGTAGTAPPNVGTGGTAAPNVETGISAARATGDSDRSPVLAVALVIGVLAAGVLLAVFIVRRWLRRRRRRELSAWLEAAAPSPSVAPPLFAPAPPPPEALPPPPPPLPTLPLPTIDLRRAPVPLPLPLAGYALTALCDDGEIIELRAAVEPSGIVVSQAQTVDEALRDVVTGRARALYVDSAMFHARELAAAVRQRNDAGWSSCPTLVHDSHRGPPDPALFAVADAVIAEPIDVSQVVAAFATRSSTTGESKP